MGPRQYRLKLDCGFWIKVSVNASLVGIITSNLKNRITAAESIRRDSIDRVIWNLQMDALESLILAAACAGVDIDSPEFKQALSTSLEAIANDS